MARRMMLLADEGGQTAVEYAMAVGVAAIAIALALALIPGDVFTRFWNTVTSALS
jgi:Flp pilus assembly pilin Flp